MESIIRPKTLKKHYCQKFVNFIEKPPSCADEDEDNRNQWSLTFLLNCHLATALKNGITMVCQILWIRATHAMQTIRCLYIIKVCRSSYKKKR